MCEGFGGVIRCGGQIVGRHPKMKVKETTDIVVFIPHTPGGILKERLQRKDAKMREAMGMWRVMFMERGGRSLRGLLCRLNPWREKECWGNNCLVCQTEAKGKCKAGWNLWCMR